MTDRQTFKLVDANTTPTEGGCGCGGHGHGHGKRAHEMAAEPIASTAGSCGCGGGGHAEGNAHPGGAGVIHAPGADELVIHSIPRVVRHAVLFAAVDALPVGENLQITCRTPSSTTAWRPSRWAPSTGATASRGLPDPSHARPRPAFPSLGSAAASRAPRGVRWFSPRCSRDGERTKRYR